MSVESSSFVGIKQRLVILGSTGSIGCAALEIVRRYPEHFKIVALVAGSNHELFAAQIDEFKPLFYYIESQQARLALATMLKASSTDSIELESEQQLLSLLRSQDYDSALAAIVGSAGLKSCAAALSAGKRVLLANKESLVCAGGLFSQLARASGASIVPVDSEHSAIFQLLYPDLARIGTKLNTAQSTEQATKDTNNCVSGLAENSANRRDLRKIILTASGGPFLRTAMQHWPFITVQEALKHPKWSMGKKISIDSATMVNKALELIEAHWLFEIDAEQIEILIHPQSIVHSLVEFIDGSQQAQLSVPDMKGAIAYALGYPNLRYPNVMDRLDLAALGSLQFESLDSERFRAPELARAALKAGSSSCVVFNLANELAVAQFLAGRIGFDRIVPFIEDSLAREVHLELSSLEELFVYQSELEERLTKAISPKLTV